MEKSYHHFMTDHLVADLIFLHTQIKNLTFTQKDHYALYWRGSMEAKMKHHFFFFKEKEENLLKYVSKDLLSTQASYLTVFKRQSLTETNARSVKIPMLDHLVLEENSEWIPGVSDFEFTLSCKAHLHD